MPPIPELSCLDYAPDNAAAIAYAIDQANRWAAIRAKLISKGHTSGRGLHLATSRIGVWMSKAARL